MNQKVDPDEIYDFIQDFTMVKGYGPSVREIAGQFEVSTSTVHRHLMALVKAGDLRATHGHARSWRVATASPLPPAP